MLFIEFLKIMDGLRIIVIVTDMAHIITRDESAFAKSWIR